MTKSSGVYQLSNGMWGFRYAYWVNGKQKDIKRTLCMNSRLKAYLLALKQSVDEAEGQTPRCEIKIKRRSRIQTKIRSFPSLSSILC